MVDIPTIITNVKNLLFINIKVYTPILWLFGHAPFIIVGSGLHIMQEDYYFIGK
jgi:hypothetical protein